jgi:integral membrane protein (TIGR00529 family)
LLMEILKLAAVFATIAAVLKLKRPLYVSIISATVIAGIIFRMSFEVFFKTVINAAISKNTLSILLVFYLIAFLQRMLEKRGSLNLAQQSLDRLFNNRRITATLAPFLLGLLPSASVVIICGEIVQKSVGSYLTPEEQAFVTSYYRHIPESFLPTYSSVLIALSLTGGKVTAGSFIIGMMPMVLVLAALGYIFYLKGVPKEISSRIDGRKWRSLSELIQGSWPIAVVIILILAQDFKVYTATAVSILLFIIIGRFRPNELKPFIKTAYEPNLLINTFFIMIFKDVLGATGIIATLPQLFSKLPIPEFLIFSLVFFFGTLVSGSQAIAVMGLPLVYMAIPNAGLPMFILLMGMAYAANQIAPTHVCLPIATEYFGISFGALVKKTIPVLAVFCSVLIGYYLLLTAIMCPKV